MCLGFNNDWGKCHFGGTEDNSYFRNKWNALSEQQLSDEQRKCLKFVNVKKDVWLQNGAKLILNKSECILYLMSPLRPWTGCPLWSHAAVAGRSFPHWHGGHWRGGRKSVCPLRFLLETDSDTNTGSILKTFRVAVADVWRKTEQNTKAHVAQQVK